MKRAKDRLHKVIVIGATPAGIAATNKLGELGIPVTLVDTDADLDAKLSRETWRLPSGVPLNYANRSGLLRIFRNPSIAVHNPARVTSLKHTPQGFAAKIHNQRTWVDPKRCILCGRCIEVCPVEMGDGKKPLEMSGRRALPGRPVIDKRREPLCQENCPLGVNAQAYVALTRAGRYAEALAVVRRHNVLPGICGRVCNHPCEDACRRSELDDPVSIRNIKRFLADWEVENNPAEPEKPERTHDEKIAVLGSGPAGLAAAADLARSGYAVTVLDREEMPGGMLRYGIGPHRLPRKILDREIAWIEALGVEIHCGVNVAENGGFDKLREEYDAVVLATGSWADRPLGMPGEDSEGVEGCLSFLHRFYRGEIKTLSGRAAVIGDGNAAFDLARALSRIGADVTLVSWFGEDAIPAHEEEVRGAREEGIEIVTSRRVTEFVAKNGKLEALKLAPTQPGEAGADGIAWPVSVPGGKAEIRGFDYAFVAIGQQGPYLADDMPDVDVNEKGFLVADDEGRTGVAGVYAAGDATCGPSTVVRAMASGRRAAAAIQRDLSGEGKYPAYSTRPDNREFPRIGEDVPSRASESMPETRPAKRRGNFNEVALGLSEAQARSEAERCLACGVCSECFLCVEACEAVGAIRHDDRAEEVVEQAGCVILADPDAAPGIKGEDVIRAYARTADDGNVGAAITRGFAAAGQAMVLLADTSHRPRGYGVPQAAPDPGLSEEVKVGVFVCRCNDSLGWDDNLEQYVESLAGKKDVIHAESIPAACTPEGVTSILKTIRQKGVTRVALASCVCCPLDFVCSACTDQRARLKDGLFRGTGVSRAMVETCNVRGEALSLLKRDPEMALARFKGLVNRALHGVRHLRPLPMLVSNYNFTTAVIGESEAARVAALTLADAGLDVFVFGDSGNGADKAVEHENIHRFADYIVRGISGTVGNFRIFTDTPTGPQTVSAGAVILGQEKSRSVPYFLQEGLPPRAVANTMQKAGVPGTPFLLPGRTSIAGLFMASPPGIAVSERKKGAAAAALAAAVMPRGPRQSKGYTVVVDSVKCRGCASCVEACPFQAITLHENEVGGWYACVDEAFCKGCGNCISVCPTGAADSPYRDQGFLEKRLQEMLA
ncbi:MAG: FAD-dependent oxidoreductase [Desulfatibacillaceae bacterium]